jgi:AraC-like DNA-binding protein
MPVNHIYIYRRIVQAKLFIDRHYSTAIHLDNISGEAYFSKFHFIRLFKKIYGFTPHQYLIRVRIERSKQMLAAQVPVTEVCFAVGFESVSTFSSLFKRTTGLSPAAFQAAQFRRNQSIARAPLQFIPNCYAKANGWS